MLNVIRYFCNNHTTTSLSKGVNILVLGFYDRLNFGDETYRYIFPYILGNGFIKNIAFKCTDDATCIPRNTDIVICGGGDIINKYFMNRVRDLLDGFYGPVYALSVGIPYFDDCEHLKLFDHVFVRTTIDYEIASRVIGSNNVTYIPDCALMLQSLNAKKDTVLNLKWCGDVEGSENAYNAISNVQNHIVSCNIGLCLAQPVFEDDSYHGLCEEICLFLSSILRIYGNAVFHFIPFNTNTKNFMECDNYIFQKLINKIPNTLLARIRMHHVADPIQMLDTFRHMNITICMRYHSLIYSFITKTRFLALHASQKMSNLLHDTKFQKYELDIRSNPIHQISNILMVMFKERIEDATMIPNLVWSDKYNDTIRNLILGQKQRLMSVNSVKRQEVTLERLLCDIKLSLQRYDQDGIVFPVLSYDKSLSLARLVCYYITRNMDHECVWGLAKNMMDSTFVLDDAIKYIYDEYVKSVETASQHRLITTETYLPCTRRKCIVTVDPFVSQTYTDIHRSGWGFVMNHIRNIDAHCLGRNTNNYVVLDTYIDRTFHWGSDTLNYAGHIPYRMPWFGILHHTFETSHSAYNCTRLFKSDIFLNSLVMCQGIITLSKYLGHQVKTHLDSIGLGERVRVFVLHHPTEFVNKTFTWSNFMNNRDRKVIQIGAWLRNPYAIYCLPLESEWMNPLKLRKAVLMGKDMSQYFAPDHMMSTLRTTLITKYGLRQYTSLDNIHVGMCRPPPSPNASKEAQYQNKYVLGMLEHIVKNHKSVEIINKVGNDAYDIMLSENIVFINLVDCSAVNTVIECIVRNTILLVNRHPALEELLGVDYPGFYENILHATLILGNVKTLQSIHTYLQRLDKSSLSINVFMDKLQDIILGIATPL